MSHLHILEIKYVVNNKIVTVVESEEAIKSASSWMLVTAKIVARLGITENIKSVEMIKVIPALEHDDVKYYYPRSGLALGITKNGTYLMTIVDEFSVDQIINCSSVEISKDIFDSLLNDY